MEFGDIEDCDGVRGGEWDDDLLEDPFAALQEASRRQDLAAEAPAVAGGGAGSARAQRHIGTLRAHVRVAMRAFQGMVSRVEGSEQAAAASCGREDVRWPSSTHDGLADHGQANGAAVSEGNAGGDIDDMLNHRETAGESVLSPGNALETEWNIPDLNLIFRPPKILMEAMAIGISPGKWVKLAPNASAGVQRSKWKTLKTVMSSGMAFKAEGQEAVNNSDEEREARKKQVQLEVEQLKNFLLSITKAWEELLLEMDDGYGGTRSRTSSPPPPPLCHDEAKYSISSSTKGGGRSSQPAHHPCASAGTNGSGAGGGDGGGGGGTASASVPKWETADGSDERSRIPQRSAISVKGIATGICQLCEAHAALTPLRAGGLLDIGVLANGISCPFPSPDAACQIIEVCGTKGAPNRPPAAQDAKTSAGNGNRLNNVCAFKIKVLNGGDNVTLRIWANGKTQTSGCKDRSMLLAVNECICQAIAHCWHHAAAHNLPSVIRGDRSMQEEAVASLTDIRVLSAHILGSWNLDLRAVGARLDMPNLCDFLAQDAFSDRVFKVSHVKPRGNSARFNNLSLYIRRECLKRWKDDGSDQTTVYVNVYETGKCSVLAAPDADVAEELADVVCDMLLEAFREHHIRIHVDEAPVPPSKRQRA